MSQVFDIIEQINERVAEYAERIGRRAFTLSVSPRSYRRLIELKAQANAIGNLIIGCGPLEEFETVVGNLRIIIDETLADTDIALA